MTRRRPNTSFYIFIAIRCTGAIGSREVGPTRGVLGASLYAQWVNVHGMSFSTTNALRAQVSGVFPSLATTITAAGIAPPTGDVQTGRAVVARFGLQ